MPEVTRAQEPTRVVRQIILEGNKRTKAQIILREVPVKVGDTIPLKSLKKKAQWISNRVFNTRLFITVNTEIKPVDSVHIDIIIQMKERWFLYPIPLLELADQNFNVWWQQRDHQLNRLNYGFFLVQKNVRGRNETLKLKLQSGFTGKTELFYNIPYIGSKLRGGLNLSLSYIYSRNVAYTLNNHKLIYYEGPHPVIRRFYGGLEYVYRKKLYTWHKVQLLLNKQEVSDSVTIHNPNFFGNDNTQRTFISLRYRFIYDHRNIQYYATQGLLFTVEALKTGMGIAGNLNLFSIRSELDYYKPLNRKFYFATGLTGKISLPRSQPFFYQKALGYNNDYVRGYELDVINGQKFLLSKNSLKFKLFSGIEQIKPVKLNQFNTVPLAIFLTANLDGGYVVDAFPIPGNAKLSNTFLLGGGLGIDFVTYYDIVFRTEYSINRLGQKGFYLHLMAAIGGKKKF